MARRRRASRTLLFWSRSADRSSGWLLKPSRSGCRSMLRSPPPREYTNGARLTKPAGLTGMRPIGLPRTSPFTTIVLSCSHRMVSSHLSLWRLRHDYKHLAVLSRSDADKCILSKFAFTVDNARHRRILREEFIVWAV